MTTSALRDLETNAKKNKNKNKKKNIASSSSLIPHRVVMAASSRVPIKAYSRVERMKELARKKALSKRNGELKVVDLAFQGFIRIVEGLNEEIVGFANPIAAGTHMYQRQGNKIRLRSIRIRGGVEFRWTNRVENAYTQKGNVCRFAIVYDTNPQGVLPLYEEIFKGIDEYGEDAVQVTSSLNPLNTGRFRVLRDFFVTGNPPYLPAQSGEAIIPVSSTLSVIDEFVDLEELETHYSSDPNPDEEGITIASCASGALYFVRVALYDGHPNHDMVWLDGCSLRLRFTG